LLSVGSSGPSLLWDLARLWSTVEDYEWFNQLVVSQLEAEGEEANKRRLAQREKSEEAPKEMAGSLRGWRGRGLLKPVGSGW